MGTITQFTPQPPSPLTPSGSDFVSDNGEISVKLTKDDQGHNVVQFGTPNDSGVQWYPVNVAYIGDGTARDNLYSAVNTSTVAIQKDTQARYVQHFGNVDDWFQVQAGQIKHYITVQQQPRNPLAFIQNARLAVVGKITIDPTWSVVAMGQAVTARVEAMGGLVIEDANGKQKYYMPAVEAWDQAGNTTDGTYIVTPQGGGVYEVCMCIPNSWVQQSDVVFPVIIDPTTIVSSAYDTSGNGGRKIVKLNNGNIYVVMKYSFNLEVYRSTDGGNTFSSFNIVNVGSTSNSVIDCALETDGTNIYCLYTVGTTVGIEKWADGNSGSLVQTQIETQTTLGNCSLAIDGNGTLWATWCSKNNTYPNAFNIRVSSSTNGGTTWSTPTQLTTNANPPDWTNPCIVIKSNNYPVIISQNSGGYIMSHVWNGTSWIAPSGNTSGLNGVVYYNATYAQSNPCAAIDGNGTIHVVWHGLDATNNVQNNIRYSKSTDGGNTWSSMYMVTTGNSSAWDCINASITVDTSTNDLYVYFQNKSGGSYYQVCKIVCTSGTWGSDVDVTSTTTGDAKNPQTLWSEFNMNSSDAVRYMYQNAQTGSVIYNSVALNSPPNAPTVTNVTSFDATQAETFNWTFSDPNGGDTQSAYEVQIANASNGTVVFDTGKVASSAGSYTLPANTLTNGNNYQWRVCTWDSSGAQGPYSSYDAFTTGGSPTVQVTGPTGTITTSGATVTWNYSDPNGNAQQSYEVQILDSTGANVLWDSGTMTTSAASARALTIGYTLANNTTYKIKVTATNTLGLSASSALSSFSTSFTLPSAASVTATPQAGNASMLVSYHNPNSSNTGSPAIASYDVSRRQSGTSAWTRIATGITPQTPATFTRSSTAYDPVTLALVPATAPRFKSAKFGNGVFIEEGTTNLVQNSDFETITTTATVFSDALTSYTGSTVPAPWTLQSGSFTFGASGATVATSLATNAMTAGNVQWKPVLGSDGTTKLALATQATFTTPSTIPANNSFLSKTMLFIDDNDYYMADIHENGNFYIHKMVGGTISILNSVAFTPVASTTYTITLSLDNTGLLTAKLYSGTGTGGTLLQTLTATDTSLTGGFLIGVGGDTGVVISNASVTAPWANGWTIGGDTRVAWGLTTQAISGAYSVSAVGVASKQGYAYSNVTLSASTQYTVSGYLNTQNVGTGGAHIAANVLGGTAPTTASVKMTTQTARYSATSTSGTSGSQSVVVVINDSGTVTFDSIQLEQKAYATSYMRNDSTSGTATRNAETLTLPSSVLNASQGTIGLWAYETQEKNYGFLFGTDYVTGSTFYLRRESNGTQYTLMVNGVAQSSVSIASIGLHHYTIKWNGSTITLYIDGVIKETINSSLVLSGLSNLYIGSNGSSAYQWNNVIDELCIFNTALTDAQVLALYQSATPQVWSTNTTALMHFDNSLYPAEGYQDFGVASNTNYDYKVTTYGSNGTSIDSSTVSYANVGTLNGLWVHDVTNPAGTIMNLLYQDNSQGSGGDGSTATTTNWQPQATTLQFAGRALPVTEFGENYQYTLTKGAVTMFASDAQWPALESTLRDGRNTLCFRDGRSRKIYGNCLGYTAKDMAFGGYQVDLVLNQNSYTEAV